MQTIQELADCFFTRYHEESFKTESKALASTMFNQRLCEQVRQMVEFHVEAALKAALEDAPYGSSTDTVSYKDMKDSILNAYPISNIK